MMRDKNHEFQSSKMMLNLSNSKSLRQVVIKSSSIHVHKSVALFNSFLMGNVGNVNA